MFNFSWSTEQSEQQTSTETQKNKMKEGPYVIKK